MLSSTSSCMGQRLAIRSPTASRVCRPSSCLSRRPVKVVALFGGGGGGGNPFGDMGKLMESVKKAQQMVQQETQRVQSELAATDFEGYDEEETVRVVMSGNQEPKSVDVTQAAMSETAEELSRRLTLAMQDSHRKSTAAMKESMKGLAKNLGIPNPGATGMDMFK